MITDIKIEQLKDHSGSQRRSRCETRFLRHIQIGMGPEMGDPDSDPGLINQAGRSGRFAGDADLCRTCSRVTAAQVKALLAPLHLIRRQDADPGLHRYAADKLEGRDPEP